MVTLRGCHPWNLHLSSLQRDAEVQGNPEHYQFQWLSQRFQAAVNKPCMSLGEHYSKCFKQMMGWLGNVRVKGQEPLCFAVTPSRGCCLCRDRRLQHPLGRRGGDGRLHRLPRPQPLPAEHVALPGAAGRDAGAERGADPGGGLRRCAHPRRDARPHRLRYVG